MGKKELRLKGTPEGPTVVEEVVSDESNVTDEAVDTLLDETEERVAAIIGLDGSSFGGNGFGGKTRLVRQKGFPRYS